MEVRLSVWNKMGGMFGRRKAAGRDDAAAAAPDVVRPMLRERTRANTPQITLPRFHTMASDQVNSRAGDRFSAMRAKLRYAFTPSQPVADLRMFAGREAVLQTTIRAIEYQRLHVVLYGERGIGKTSLLHMLTQAAAEARYIVIYSSCGANSTFDETFRAAAANIPLLFHSGFAPTTAEAEKGSSLADLMPSTPLTPSKFGDLCAKLTGTRVLIILDEFDRCESGAFRRDVAELIKNLSDRLGRVQLVLAGVAADLTELVEHIPSIRRNIFAVRVPKMTDAEVLQIVANGEREAGFTFDLSASQFVVAVARGSPYIASLLCHHAGHVALDMGRHTVLPSDVSSAVERAVAEFQGRITKFALSHIRKLQREGHSEIMAVAARAALATDGEFFVSDLEAYDDIDARKAQKIVDTLRAEGLIVAAEEEEGSPRYSFCEEGVPTYLWISWAQERVEPAPSTRKAPAATTAAASPRSATAS